MTLPKPFEGQDQQSKTPLKKKEKETKSRGELPKSSLTITERLEQLEALPRRNAALHWATFTLALLSLVLLATWVFSSRGPVPAGWIWLEIGLAVIFAIEFFTRSGFRWDRRGYLRTRFFEFVAIVPVLALVHHGFFWEGAWVWLILVMRVIRVFDRFLGDGFASRNVLALVEGFEEEITDRVFQRIIVRMQADVDRAGFSHVAAEALLRNKAAVLERVKAATPREGVVPGLAHVVKLDAVLERAEERTYDAVVKILDSEEVDAALRDVINSSFSRMHDELSEKSWRKHLGIRGQRDK
jgi:hypothetical protein